MYRYVFDMSGWVYPLGHVHFDVFGGFDVIRRVYPPFHVDFAFYDVLGWIYPPQNVDFEISDVSEWVNPPIT